MNGSTPHPEPPSPALGKAKDFVVWASPKTRYTIILVCIALLGLLAYYVLGIWHEVGLIKSAKLTSLCSPSAANYIRSAPNTLDYLIFSGNVANITNYMNQACLTYQNQTNGWGNLMTTTVNR